MEKNPLKSVLIIGSYGASNLGDEALLEQVLKNLPNDTKKYVLSGDIEDTRKRHSRADAVSLHFPFGLRSFFSFKWIKSIELLRDSDLVLFGGGGLLTDHRTVKAVALWTWQAFWVRLFRKPLILVGNSIGPFRTSIGRIFAKWTLKQAKAVWVRDQLSLETAQEIAPSSKIQIGADLAFLSKAKKEKKQKILAINLRPWKIVPELRELISEYKEKGFKILLVPMEEQDIAQLEKFDGEVVKAKNYAELLEALAPCEKAVGMRLHFLIAASLAGCETTGISYSDKVNGLLDDLELKHCLPETEPEELSKLVAKSKKAHHLDEQFDRAKKMLEAILPSS